MRTSLPALLLITALTASGCSYLGGSGSGNNNAGGGGGNSGGGGSSGGGSGSGNSSAVKYSGHVKGTITFREKIMLPPECQVTVQVIDVSRQDAKAQVIGEQRFNTGGKGPPYAFDVTYDPAAITAQNTYHVRAEITLRGSKRFTSTTAIPVITQNAPQTAEIVVQAVRQ